MSKFPLLNAALSEDYVSEAEDGGFLSRIFGRPSTTTRGGVTKPVQVKVAGASSEQNTSDDSGSALSRFITDLVHVGGNFRRVVIRTMPTTLQADYLKKPGGTFFSQMTDQEIMSLHKNRRSSKSDFQIMPKGWKFSDQLGSTSNSVVILIDAYVGILAELDKLKGEPGEVVKIRQLFNQISELKYYRMTLNIGAARKAAPAIDAAGTSDWEEIAKAWDFKILHQFPRGKSVQADLEREFAQLGFKESPEADEAELQKLRRKKAIKDLKDTLVDKPTETGKTDDKEEPADAGEADEPEPEINKTSAADNQKPTDDVQKDLKFAIENWATWKNVAAKRQIMDIAEPNLSHTPTDNVDEDLGYIIKNWKRLSDATKRQIMALNEKGRQISRRKE